MRLPILPPFNDGEVPPLLIPTPIPTTPEDPSPRADVGYFEFGEGGENDDDGDGVGKEVEGNKEGV